MLNSMDIRNVKFSKSMSGYKQEEVDILLDRVEADYEQFERIIAELNGKIEKLNGEVAEFNNSQSSLQSVLLSAQKLADQIVAEAKEKSEEIIRNAESSIETITIKEKELSEAFERKAEMRKSQVEKEIETVVEDATSRAKAIEKATEDSVKRQQLLFDKTKLEISAFKAEVTKLYKEHLEILQKLPDEVPMDPTHIAEVVSANLEKTPDATEFIEEEKTEDVLEQIFSETEDSSDEGGFVIVGEEE